MFPALSVVPPSLRAGHELQRQSRLARRQPALLRVPREPTCRCQTGCGTTDRRRRPAHDPQGSSHAQLRLRLRHPPHPGEARGSPPLGLAQRVVTTYAEGVARIDDVSDPADHRGLAQPRPRSRTGLGRPGPRGGARPRHRAGLVERRGAAGGLGADRSPSTRSCCREQQVVVTQVSTGRGVTPPRRASRIRPPWRFFAVGRSPRSGVRLRPEQPVGGADAGHREPVVLVLVVVQPVVRQTAL